MCVSRGFLCGGASASEGECHSPPERVWYSTSAFLLIYGFLLGSFTQSEVRDLLLLTLIWSKNFQEIYRKDRKGMHKHRVFSSLLPYSKKESWPPQRGGGGQAVITDLPFPSVTSLTAVILYRTTGRPEVSSLGKCHSSVTWFWVPLLNSALCL